MGHHQFVVDYLWAQEFQSNGGGGAMLCEVTSLTNSVTGQERLLFHFAVTVRLLLIDLRVAWWRYMAKKQLIDKLLMSNRRRRSRSYKFQWQLAVMRIRCLLIYGKIN